MRASLLILCVLSLGSPAFADASTTAVSDAPTTFEYRSRIGKGRTTLVVNGVPFAGTNPQKDQWVFQTLDTCESTRAMLALRNRRNLAGMASVAVGSVVISVASPVTGLLWTVVGSGFYVAAPPMKKIVETYHDHCA